MLLFLLKLYNTGARVSEIIGVKVGEVVLDEVAACVHLHGKGRKQRSVPLWHTTVKTIRAWLESNPQLIQHLHCCRSVTGCDVALSGRKAAIVGSGRRPPDIPIKKKRVLPHIRHTTAMHLLQAGVDISVIALWLGHESSVTTHCYVEADSNEGAYLGQAS